MIKIKLLIIVGIFISMLGLQNIPGQDNPSMSEEEMTKKWMVFATPGKYHKLMEKKVGKWEAKTKMWEIPGKPPVESTASAVGEMILGGRYLKQSYRGSMMGMSFEGVSIQGYNNFLKKYKSIWIDSMGTGFFVSTGTVDESGKVLTEWSETVNFMTGKKEKGKSVTTMIDDDQFKMEMFMIMPDGTEFKNLEVLYFRKN